MSPNESKKSDPNLFRGMEPPSLPAGLKRRVLHRARHAARFRRPLTDRLWEDRRIRWAWAAIVVMLLGIHLVLAAPMKSSAGRSTDGRFADSTSTTEPDFAPFLARHPTAESSGLLHLHSFQFFVPHTADDPTS